MTSLIQLLIGILKANKHIKKFLAILSFLLLLASVWVYLGTRFSPNWWYDRFRLRVELVSEPLLAIAVVSALVLGLCFLASQSIIDFDTLEVELKPIRKEREEIRQRIDHDSAANVLNTIQLGLNQITEYYTINKSQARNSFSFSVFAVVTGLLTLIGGIWLFYFGKTPNVGLAALSGIGGLLLQFIGGASFYIYNKSLSQLNYFYDKLVRMQDTMLSIQLCGQLEDKARRSAIQERLILEILTRHGTVPPTSVGVPPDGQEKRQVLTNDLSPKPTNKKAAASGG
jgi:hypothetical protein